MAPRNGRKSIGNWVDQFLGVLAGVKQNLFEQSSGWGKTMYIDTQ